VNSLSPLGQLANLTSLNISYVDVIAEDEIMDVIDDLPDWLREDDKMVVVNELPDWLREVQSKQEEALLRSTDKNMTDDESLTTKIEEDKVSVAGEDENLSTEMSDLERLLAEEGIDLNSVEEEIPEGAKRMSVRHWMISTSHDELIWRWIGAREGLFLEEELSNRELLIEKAIKVIREYDKVSVSLLQRRLRIGYAQAAQLIDEMENQGIIGPDLGGGRNREVLIEGKGIDFTFLTNLTQLTHLDISETRIDDFNLLSNLSKLTSLNIRNTAITDITVPSNLSLLSILDMGKTKIADFGPLVYLTNLTRLDISGTSVSDLSPLARLSQLSMLNISNSDVTDLSPLARLSQLSELHIGQIQVSDLSPLAQLTSLTKLDISGTPVSDFSPLIQLNNLTELNVTGMQISESNYDLLKNMKKLNVIGKLLLGNGS
jgi:hypothetical protein